MNFSEKIEKLNVLEKLLRQDLINIRKSLGDEAIISQVNEEVKAFLLAEMDRLLNNVPPASPFSAQETQILKEFAGKVIAKATGQIVPTEVSPVTPPAPPTTITVSDSKRKESPVLQALKTQGFNSNATLEERKAMIKSVKPANK